jgi:uncharacterized coiled-coil DUF342 family protein
MNAAQRKTITEITDKLNTLVGELENLQSEIETLRDEEQEKFDNMPEGLQQGDNGQAIEQAANDLDEAAGNVGASIDGANDAVSTLENLT